MRKPLVRSLITFVRAVAYVIFFQSVITAVPYMILGIFDLTMGEPGRNIYIENINLIGAAADIVAVALLLLLERKIVRSVKEDIEFRSISWPAAIGCVLAGAALNIFVASVLEIMPIPDAVWSSYSEAIAPTTVGSVWIRAAFVCLIAPACEEIVFRGLVFNTCRRGMNLALAVAVGAVAFGVVHSDILWICYAAVCGLFMIMAFLKSGTIIGSMLMHISFNTFSMFFMRRITWMPVWWRIALSAAVLGGSFALIVYTSGKSRLTPGLKERLLAAAEAQANAETMDMAAETATDAAASVQAGAEQAAETASEAISDENSNT